MVLTKIITIAALYIAVASASEVTKKRGLYDGNFGNGYQQHFGSNDLSFSGLSSEFGKGGSNPNAVSPAEIASAISGAKEASAQVQAAQHRVNIAKESVLHQQRIASQKEAHAAAALQRAEAAAAVHRQEANAAATAVVLAQQRLAQAKADVADQQRIAAAKESHAAEIIQRSAAAAAAEIQRTEHTAAKIAALQRSGSNAFKHVSASKDATLSAAAAAVASTVNSPYGSGGVHGSPGGYAGAGGPWFGAVKYIASPWN